MSKRKSKNNDENELVSLQRRIKKMEEKIEKNHMVIIDKLDSMMEKIESIYTEQPRKSKSKKNEKNEKRGRKPVIYRNPGDNEFNMVSEPIHVFPIGKRLPMDKYTRDNLFEVVDDEGVYNFMMINDDNCFQIIPQKLVPTIFSRPVTYKGKRYTITPTLAKKFGNRYVGENRILHAFYPDPYYNTRYSKNDDGSKIPTPDPAKSFIKVFE